MLKYGPEHLYQEYNLGKGTGPPSGGHILRRIIRPEKLTIKTKQPSLVYLKVDSCYFQEDVLRL